VSTAAGRGGLGSEEWGIVDLWTWWSSNSGIDERGVLFYSPGERKWGVGWVYMVVSEGKKEKEREKERKGRRVKEGNMERKDER